MNKKISQEDEGFHTVNPSALTSIHEWMKFQQFSSAKRNI